MADPLSIASGVAGIITLTSAIVAAGYKYLDAVRSAPQDIKDLMREITLLNTIVSQLATHSFLAEPGSYPSLAALNNQNIYKDCESTLLVVRQHLDKYEPTNKSRRKNALKTLSWPVGQKDIIKGRERIERLCNVLNTAVALDNASSLNRLEALQHLSLGSTQTLLDVSCGLEEQNILEWLSVLNPKVKHTSTRQLQQPGTCDWLLREEIIKQWSSESGPDFVWLRGSSGSGKTVLISNVIGNLQHRIQTCATLGAVAYHYCEFANPTTLDARQILSSILRQVVEQVDEFPSVLRDTYQQHSQDAPSLEILRSLLHKIAKASFEPVYVIIDGIDECPNRQAIVQMVLKLQSQPRANPRIKIMVSSRPEHDLQKAWVDRPHFSILPQHLQIPLEVHVQKELLKIPKLLRLDPIFRADLANDLVSRADGMFRWVQCQIDALRKARTSIALQRVLLGLPEGLFETYDRILERVDDIDQEYVLRALKWLVGSERPLSLEELAEAIAIDESQALFDLDNRFIEPEEILELCGSLVSIRSDHKVVLAHFSVREYLLSCQLRERKPLAKFALDDVTSGQYISRCLLTYAYTVGLHIQELDSEVLNEAQYPLLRYIYDSSAPRFQDFIAMSQWTEAHFPAQAKTSYRQLISIVQYAKPPAPYEENWEDAWAVKGVLQCALMCYWDGCLGHERRGERIVTGNSVSKGIGEMFVALQQEWDDPKSFEFILGHIDARTTPSPLCTATTKGFKHAARALLERGAQVDGMTAPFHVGNASARALSCGYVEIFQLLEEFGANINTNCRYSSTCGALLLASRFSAGRALIPMLLRRPELDLNMTDCFGRTIHYWAKHDHHVARGLWRYASILERARDYDVEFLDREKLYSTILTILRDMKGRPGIGHHYGRAILANALTHCGAQYYEYATIFDEQALTVRDTIMSPYSCDLCPDTIGGQMQGTRFKCLQCHNTDFCASCYSMWQKSQGKMDICKGHTFRQIPRLCWFTLKSGTVTEDGRTLAEVIDYLIEDFAGLLDDLGRQDKIIQSTTERTDALTIDDYAVNSTQAD